METDPLQFAPPIHIVASRRRRRTVAARLRSGVLELLVPDWMPHVERERWAEEMRGRLAKRMERAQPSDAKLATRARPSASVVCDTKVMPLRPMMSVVAPPTGSPE